MKIKNLNGSDVSFDQDSHISFEESGHTYTVDGIGEMASVSSIVAQFFKPFNARFWSIRKCDGDGIKAAQLREEWDFKGFSAVQVGTFLHKQIERYLNGFEIEKECLVDFVGTFLKKNEQVRIDKEWSYFQDFVEQTAFTPFRTEWSVYDAEARMAGTIDLVCACEDGSYEIYDWKRSCKVDPYEKNRRSNGLNGLGHLKDTTYIHYCLQQNLYRYMLEKNYGIRISRMNLVVLHPKLPKFQVVAIPRMEKEVEIILKNKKQLGD